MRKFWIILFVMLAGYVSAAEKIVLVQGTSSTPNDGEKKYAESVVRNMKRWLSDISIPLSVVTDEDVVSGGLNGATVAILTYNPNPTAQEMKALSAFSERGGKLIVFYGADSRLADLMEVKLGDYKSAAQGHWKGFQFASGDNVFAGKTVYQDSRNIRLAHPVKKKSRVIAYWITEQDKQLDDPAVLESGRGFWVTHVLLNDQDLYPKKMMLLSFIGKYEPSVWQAAAKKMFNDACTIGGSVGFESTFNGIKAKASAGKKEKEVFPQLEKASEIYKKVQSAEASSDFGQISQLCSELRKTLVTAYGMVQSARENEIHGVWEHWGTGLYPGDWDKTCAVLEKNGITDLFCNLLWPYQAHYKSALLPSSQVFGLYGDQAKQALDAAHKHGIRIHAWKVCWNLENAPDDLIQRFKKEGRLAVDTSGQTVKWMCPSSAENLRYEKDAVRELVKNYGFDGVHLDYIRYKDSSVCFCVNCKEQFQKAAGISSIKWPEDAVVGGKHRAKYEAWRAGNITRLVRDISAIVKEANPKASLSAAVYGKYPQCVPSVAQDWYAWLKEGVVDFVCPMNYTADPAKFAEYLKMQADLPGAKGKIISGIGVTAMESILDPVQTIEQVNMIRSAGMPGFVLFDLNRILESDILPVLSRGMTSK